MITHFEQSDSKLYIIWTCLSWILPDKTTHSDSITTMDTTAGVQAKKLLVRSTRQHASKIHGTEQPCRACSFFTSSMLGAGTRTPRQRLRTAGITLLGELQQRISRQDATYFSMVRRKACCASLVSRSTSDRITTIAQANTRNRLNREVKGESREFHQYVSSHLR